MGAAFEPLRVRVRKALAVLFPAATALGVVAAPSLRAQELHSAQTVRSLTAEEAARSLPVRLRGVVTFFDEDLFSRFIQDDTAGIYLQQSTNTPALTPGQVVEIEGATSPGEYAPIIEPRRVRIFGQGSLPSAKPVTFEQLASGGEDSQFVEVGGIVRSVELEKASRCHVLALATGGGRLTVYVRELPALGNGDLVDATVRVRGVCSTKFNRQRQLFAIRLMVPRATDLVVEKLAGGDPFAAPALSIGSLLQFTPQGTYGRRLKVAGRVAYQQPGRFLYIQDETYGLRVETRQMDAVREGDRVEVLGFTARGEYTPVLEDAVYRRIAAGPAPRPDNVDLDEALRGTHDCRLIRLEATLLDIGRQSREQFLVLQSGDFIFHGHLEPQDGLKSFPDVQRGSKVAVTGICLIEPGDWQAGESWRAKSFQLLVRSPGDLIVLKAAPWWTLKRLLWIAGLLATLALAALAWVAILRRRVQKQTQIIRQQLQLEATLKERYVNLFENANDMVFTHDLAGRITSINEAGERLLQRRREQILSHNLLDLVAEDQRAAATQWLREVVKEPESPTVEWDFVNAAGQRVRLELSTRLIQQDGDQVEVEGIARDITERRRLEREILEISSREQRRIGHDLHDGVCQQLAGIAYRLSILGDRLQAKAVPESAEAEQIANLINDTNSQARMVARGLFPVRLQENGLVAALEELADSTGERFNVNARFSCATPPFTVDNEVALHLYFIAQEALLNAVRHGGVRDVTIALQPRGQRYELTVQDNGKGFETGTMGQTGMGIRIMRYRARVIGAILDVISRPGQGTRISCVFSPVLRENLRELKP